MPKSKNPPNSLNMKANESSPILLLVEILIIFIVLPVLAYQNLLPFPKPALLVLVAFYAIVVAYRSSKNRRLRYWTGDFKIRRFTLYLILIRFLIASILVLSYVRLFEPAHYLKMPLEQTSLWLTILLLYPFSSALPQEWIYRNFFFKRYAPLFPAVYRRIIASIFLFTFLHIVYDAWFTLLLSAIGGAIFTHTYLKTQSLWWTTIEHTLYGILIFTSGLGHYFFEGF